MAVFFKEKLTLATVSAIVLSFAGVLLLYWTPDGGQLSALGVVLVLISALTYAVYIIIMNRAKLEMSAFKINFYVLIYCALGNLLMSFCMGQGFQVPATASSWFYVGWLAVGIRKEATTASCSATTRRGKSPSPPSIIC